MALFSRIRLVLPFKRAGFSKVNSIKDRRCFSALPILFFIILQRSLWEYQGQASDSPRTIPSLDGLVRRLLCSEEK